MNANDIRNRLQIFYATEYMTTAGMTPANTGNCEKVITDPQCNSKRTKGNVD
jgi:hypothetical protein